MSARQQIASVSIFLYQSQFATARFIFAVSRLYCRYTATRSILQYTGFPKKSKNKKNTEYSHPRRGNRCTAVVRARCQIPSKYPNFVPSAKQPPPNRIQSCLSFQLVSKRLFYFDIPGNLIYTRKQRQIIANAKILRPVQLKYIKIITLENSYAKCCSFYDLRLNLNFERLKKEKCFLLYAHKNNL